MVESSVLLVSKVQAIALMYCDHIIIMIFLLVCLPCVVFIWLNAAVYPSVTNPEVLLTIQ